MLITFLVSIWKIISVNLCFPKTHFLESSLLLCYISVKFNLIIKGYSKFVSEAYLSNHFGWRSDTSWPATKTGIGPNLRKCFWPRWKYYFIRGNYPNQDEKKTTSEVESLIKMLNPTGMIIYIYIFLLPCPFHINKIFSIMVTILW